MEYLPPLVAHNRLEPLFNIKQTLEEKGLAIGGYIRISTHKESQLSSIENQKKFLSQWAQVNGYHLAGFYIDVKSGAYEYLRDDMNRLKKDIAQGKIKGLICKEISRTSRDILDIVELKRGLSDKGAFFIAIKEGYDSRTDDDEFLLIIHAGLAQKERKITGSRVKITQLIKAREGKTNVSDPAYGYSLSKEGHTLVVNPDTAPVYRLITDKFLEGWGQLRICRFLNASGYKPKRGTKWHVNSIKTILSNPVYLGVTIYNATTLIRDSAGHQKRMVRPRNEWVVKDNTHEPLIAPDKFQHIQDLIQERKEQDKKEWSCTKKYLLSGLLYCESCGGKLYGCKIPKRPKSKCSDKGYWFYYSDRNLSGRCTAQTKYYQMERVEHKVLEELKRFLLKENKIADIIKSKSRSVDKRCEKGHVEWLKLKGNLEAVETAVRLEQEAYEQGVLAMDEYQKRIAVLRGKKHGCLKKMRILGEQLLHTDTNDRYCQDLLQRVLRDIEHLDELPRDIIDLFLRKVFSKIIIKEGYELGFEYAFEED